MKRSAPGWLTWALVAALAALFLGERVLADTGSTRYLFSGGGALVVLAALIVRLVAWQSAGGERRRIERALALGYLGTAVALALYFVPLALHPEPSRVWTALQVLWPILLACSIAPAVAAQWALGPLAATTEQAHAEAQRVGEVAASALTVGLATAFLFVTMYIAAERDVKLDVSYFKTSSPGTATVNIVDSLNEPLKVKLFFPPVNEVKDEVSGYFRELAARTNKVQLEQLDRMVDSKQAQEYRVTKDGTVVLVKGDQNRAIPLDTDLAKARTKLRGLDEEVQKALFKVARDTRTAYLVVGHEELNDPGATDRDPRDLLNKASAVSELLTLLNYRVKELGLRQGLANQVPDDASLVMLLGPRKPLLDAELAALDAYAARGGALFIALEPETAVELGPLGKRLGVRFDPTPLADTTAFLRTYMTDADHRNLVTDQFSAHASVTTLSRARAGAGMVLVGAGSLEEIDFAPALGDAKPRRTHVIRSLTSTFRDTDADLAFDEGEERKSYNLVSAIEGPKPPPAADGKQAEPMRALVFADAQVLSDAVLASQALGLNRALVLDSIKWLGGEEKLSGEVVSEKDVPIEHTKEKDVVWFYSTIIGAPLLVLGLGLTGVRIRRRRLGAREV
jgi:hypothetical protein